MQWRSFTLFLNVIAFVLAVGCANSTKIGLSNVRASESRQPRTSKTYDVVANGDNSCERAGYARPDPAPIRANPCPGNEGKVSQTPATQ